MGEQSRPELRGQQPYRPPASWAGRVAQFPASDWERTLGSVMNPAPDDDQRLGREVVNDAVAVYNRDRSLAYQTFKASTDAAWQAYNRAMQAANEEYDRAVITAGAAYDRALVNLDH